MITNLDKLPKIISFRGNWYELDLHITAFGKLCVSYQYNGGSARAVHQGIETFILSQVVEPTMEGVVQIPEYPIDITDVHNYEEAFNTLFIRVNAAIEKGQVILIRR